MQKELANKLLPRGSLLGRPSTNDYEMNVATAQTTEMYSVYNTKTLPGATITRLRRTTIQVLVSN